MTGAYAISLTSIPPRLPRIAPVLRSLLGQQPAPLAVYLCLPRHWHRFPGVHPSVTLPAGVQLLSSEEDFGPATKALVAAQHLAGQGIRLIYCDDDWLYPKEWAAELLQAGHPEEAVAASGFNVARLKRIPNRCRATGHADIAQGFGGVCVAPEWLSQAGAIPPPQARGADDIWLSGVLAHQGIPIRLSAAARDGMVPAFSDGHALQDVPFSGFSRPGANLAALNALTDRFGLWPPVAPPGRPLGGQGTGRSSATARAARSKKSP